MNAAQRVQAIMTVIQNKTYTWTSGGVTFRVSAPYLLPGGFGVTVEAWDQNGPLPTDNLYQFFNPPTAVVVQEAVYDAEGNLVTPRVVQQNIVAALKAMVEDAVLTRARQLGWSP